MSSPTTHYLLEILHDDPPGESHSCSYTKLLVLYTHVCPPPTCFYSCYCLGLNYSSHCSPPDWLITLNASAQASPLTGRPTCFLNSLLFLRTDSLTSILCSSLSPHCTMWCSSATFSLVESKCHFSQLGMNRVLLEREGGVYLRQGMQYEQAELGICFGLRINSIQKVWG